MLRPSRRAKQKPIQAHEIVGLLPSEEAAIHRAMLASLAKQPKDSASENESSPKGKTVLKRSPKLPAPRSKKMKVKRSLKPINTKPELLTTVENSHNTKSMSTSPLSTTSSASFLSSDSVSSTSWTPGRLTPTFKSKGRKKPDRKNITPRKPVKLRKIGKDSTSEANCKVEKQSKSKPKKLSPPSNKRAIIESLKSIHKSTPDMKGKKRTKLLARAVRKQAAFDDEPRNQEGLTVDEILTAIARLNKVTQELSTKSPKSVARKSSKVKTQSPSAPKKSPKQSSKCASPKNSSSSPPLSRLKSVQNSPKSQEHTCTPKRSLGNTPKSSKSPKTPKRIKPLSLPTLASSVNPPKPVNIDDRSVSDTSAPPNCTSTSEKSVAAQEGQSSEPSGAAKIETPESQSPNSLSYYQAQRKFASNHSPPARSSNRELASPPSLKETPKTEDFINFLCLRGSSTMPDHYKKFDLPWTPIKQDQGGGNKDGNGKRVGRDKPTVGLGLTAKKLDFTSSGIQVG